MEPISFLAASIALLVTPGPTNTLLATSGAAIGVRRSLPLLAAELCGYLTAIVFLLVVAGPVIAMMPAVEVVLRIAVTGYLLNLALKLWRHGSTSLVACGPVTFEGVLLTTLLNPKAIIFAFTILPQQPDLASLLPWLAALAQLIVMIGGGWIAIGASLRHGFQGVISPAVGYRISALALTLLAGAVSARAFM